MRRENRRLATVIDIASRRVVGWPPPTTRAPNWSPTPCELPATSRTHSLTTTPTVSVKAEQAQSYQAAVTLASLLVWA
ncbi:hypothetical protein SGPA1_40618 [Streptomyces misionensis JCM 4497]